MPMLRFELFQLCHGKTVTMFLYFGGRLKLMLSMKNVDIFILWDRKGHYRNVMKTVTSGHWRHFRWKGPTGVLQIFRLRIRITYFRFRTWSLPVMWLPVTSLSVMWLPVAPHCSPTNMTLFVLIYHSCIFI